FWSLITNYATSEDWAAVVQTTAGVAETAPDFVEATEKRGYALLLLGRAAEASKVLEHALDKHADEIRLLFMRAEIAVMEGSWSAAQPWLDKVVSHPHVKPNDLNGVAWTRLFYDPDPTKATAVGATAMALAQEK